MLQNKKKYILQTKEKGYYGCYLISLLNVCIYYRKPFITSLDDSKWKYLVDKYHCREEGCVGRSTAAEEIGLDVREIDQDEIPNNLPVIISSRTKVGYHSSLIIKCRGDKWTIVNYNAYRGNVITVVNKNDIEFLPMYYDKDEPREAHCHASLKLLGKDDK